MNYTRIILASLGGVVAYVAFGFLVFTRPAMRVEFLKYPAVYRSQESMRRVMPFGLLGMMLSMVVLAVLYAMLYRGGNGILEGARFGALVGMYAFGSFVLHNHVNLNIGTRLTIYQAAAYFVEWTIVGIVIGFIYRSGLG